MSNKAGAGIILGIVVVISAICLLSGVSEYNNYHREAGVGLVGIGVFALLGVGITLAIIGKSGE